MCLSGEDNRADKEINHKMMIGQAHMSRTRSFMGPYKKASTDPGSFLRVRPSAIKDLRETIPYTFQLPRNHYFAV
ncbi:hypothetical protein V6N12_059189 [Hibiscus sabdariffa]|uniref:Uncharacterized protein n=1 Tax=Hibiscus sabdariffa TaxID=183260 RepID=A0ABR2EUB9_9ROSI